MKPDFQMKTICLLLVLPNCFCRYGTSRSGTCRYGYGQGQWQTAGTKEYRAQSVLYNRNDRQRRPACISGKDTPQSVSVMTRRQIDDKAIYSLEEAMKNYGNQRGSRFGPTNSFFCLVVSMLIRLVKTGITTNVSERSGYTAKLMSLRAQTLLFMITLRLSEVQPVFTQSIRTRWNH